ncbi:hypothetical protein RRG08_062037 [Elysia crispata]|uniref:Uncharacterized protein n=1 Tax=Elysia crispata TaxID=231223 RepID=A0AAE1A4P2_9GAST|nr:hypothetical protein RRG08_062037 [Elysia crispata]
MDLLLFLLGPVTMVGNGTIPLAAKVMKELGLGQYRKTRCVERERQAGPNLRVGKLITALSSSIRNLVAFAFFEMPMPVSCEEMCRDSAASTTRTPQLHCSLFVESAVVGHRDTAIHTKPFDQIQTREHIHTHKAVEIPGQ